MHAEAINDEFSAFESTLKLPLTGYRKSANAVLTTAFTSNFGYYWSSTADSNTAARNPAASNTAAKVFSLDTYNTFISPAERGYVFGKLTDFPGILRQFQRHEINSHLVLLDYFRPWTIP